MCAYNSVKAASERQLAIAAYEHLKGYNEPRSVLPPASVAVVGNCTLPLGRQLKDSLCENLVVMREKSGFMGKIGLAMLGGATVVAAVLILRDWTFYGGSRRFVVSSEQTGTMSAVIDDYVEGRGMFREFIGRRMMRLRDWVRKVEFSRRAEVVESLDLHDRYKELRERLTFGQDAWFMAFYYSVLPQLGDIRYMPRGELLTLLIRQSQGYCLRNDVEHEQAARLYEHIHTICDSHMHSQISRK
jgi:hypothetical protein